MKKTCTVKLDKPVVLTVIMDDKKEDKKVYLSCEYTYEANVASKELENRIEHDIALEILLVCSMKYALGISFQDILSNHIDISAEMYDRLKWNYNDECKLIDFKVVQAHFEREELNRSIKWLCSCGAVNDSKFCPKCGKPKSLERWVCICGQVNIGKFCTRCSTPRDSEF